MAWVLLLFAGLFEVAWAYGLKVVGLHGPGIAGIIAALGLSLVLLAVAMKTSPLGTAYAIWTGIGIIGSFIVSIFVLGEQTTPGKMISVALIIAGIVGLRVNH